MPNQKSRSVAISWFLGNAVSPSHTIILVKLRCSRSNKYNQVLFYYTLSGTDTITTFVQYMVLILLDFTVN